MPIQRFATPGVQLRFADLVLAAADRGELAIGWQFQSGRSDRDSGFGVPVHPARAETVTCGSGDQLDGAAQDS